jgi:hypothetical protein
MSLGDSKPLIRAAATAVAVVVEQLVSELLSALYEWIRKRRTES